ncbi:MAG: hypothetical protein HYY24_23130 [Verrucomicrobia bacterium]|nr:hypothetical protein [Verrucomicrobiota bacterium]
MPSQSLVVGYHGCDRRLVEKVVAGVEVLKPSQNARDLLGHGIYFWEDSHARAMRWAEAESERRRSSITAPAVLGAIIQLGNFLNLMETEALSLVKSAHVSYLSACASTGSPAATNRGPELRARFLDCAVIQTLHQLRREQGKAEFDTVRGFNRIRVIQPRMDLACQSRNQRSAAASAQAPQAFTIADTKVRPRWATEHVCETLC